MGKIMMRQVRGVPIKKVLLDGGEEYEVHPDFLNPDCKFKKKKFKFQLKKSGQYTLWKLAALR